jgi:hypothetical protein
LRCVGAMLDMKWCFPSFQEGLAPVSSKLIHFIVMKRQPISDDQGYEGAVFGGRDVLHRQLPSKRGPVSEITDTPFPRPALSVEALAPSRLRSPRKELQRESRPAKPNLT